VVENDVASGRVRIGYWYILDFPPSLTAAQAAECAGAQDPQAFWRMHRLLYERQSQLWSADADTYQGFAQEIGLEGETFRRCMADPAVAARIQELDRQRRDADIRVRPSFDINGRIYRGALPYNTLRQIFAQP